MSSHTVESAGRFISGYVRDSTPDELREYQEELIEKAGKLPRGESEFVNDECFKQFLNAMTRNKEYALCCLDDALERYPDLPDFLLGGKRSRSDVLQEARAVSALSVMQFAKLLQTYDV